MANSENAQPMPMSTPDPALGRLEKLVGTWELSCLLSLDVHSREVFLPWLEEMMFISIHQGDAVGLHFSATMCRARY